MTNDLPSFEKAEYSLSAAPRAEQCTRCAQTIRGSYYRVNGNLTCEACAAQAQSSIPADSHSAFSRAILYGIGAAVVGMIAYAAFEIATGIIIGYLALGVGYIIARAMKAGSKGLGGRKYQIAAVLLTYAAVSLAAIPVAIFTFSKAKTAQRSSATAGGTDVQSTETQSSDEGTNQRSSVPKSPAGLVVTLLGLGLASPFLELSDGVGGIIGLFILFIGMRMAWRMTAGHDATVSDVSGPYRVETGTA